MYENSHDVVNSTHAMRHSVGCRHHYFLWISVPFKLQKPSTPKAVKIRVSEI